MAATDDVRQSGATVPHTSSDDAWERDLTAAFSILLGRPVDSFDPMAEYAPYYRHAHIPAERLFELVEDASWLERTFQPDDDDGRAAVLDLCLSPDWGLDLGGSLFLPIPFDEDSAFSQAFDAGRAVTGRELANMLLTHGLGPADIAAGIRANTLMIHTGYRIVCDGTLRDAMRTAIRAKRGPDGLRSGPGDLTPGPYPQAITPFAYVFADHAETDELPPNVAAARDRLLSPIRDPRLRAHVWSPFLDRCWERPDNYAVGPDHTRTGAWEELVAALPGATVAAVWDLAYYGEVSIAIMQVPNPTPSTAG